MKAPSEHEKTRKVTMNLPDDLVDFVLEARGEGVTETVRRLLQEEKRRIIFKQFINMRGKIKFEQTYEEIKEARK